MTRLETFTSRCSPAWWLLLLIPLYFTWTFDHSLWNPDETRDAGIAKAMYTTANYAVPKLNGEAFLEKPPLYYWVCSALYKMTGHVTAGTTRLPSVLFGLLGIFFSYAIGKQLGGERCGIWAACIIATSAQYFRMSHFATMDICLTAMVTGALLFYLRNSWWGFTIFCLLAFYTKGFLGILLPGLVVSTDLILKKKFKKLLLWITFGGLFFILVVGPWFWSLYQEGGRRYLEIFLIDNHWKRFFSSTSEHADNSRFLYILSFPGDFFPWSIPFIGMIISIIRGKKGFSQWGALQFPIIWFLVLFTFFSVSSSKRSIYLLPLFPAAAVAVALWWDQRNPIQARQWIRGGTIFLSLAAVSGSIFAIKKLDQNKSFVPFCDQVKARLDKGPVMAFDMSEMERGVFGFYIQDPIPNPKTLTQLEEKLKEWEGQPFNLIVNRTRLKDVTPLLEGRAKIIYEYRPDKKTRSYVLFQGKS